MRTGPPGRLIFAGIAAIILGLIGVCSNLITAHAVSVLPAYVPAIPPPSPPPVPPPPVVVPYETEVLGDSGMNAADRATTENFIRGFCDLPDWTNARFLRFALAERGFDIFGMMPSTPGVIPGGVTPGGVTSQGLSAALLNFKGDSTVGGKGLHTGQPEDFDINLVLTFTTRRGTLRVGTTSADFKPRDGKAGWKITDGVFQDEQGRQRPLSTSVEWLIQSMRKHYGPQFTPIQAGAIMAFCSNFDCAGMHPRLLDSASFYPGTFEVQVLDMTRLTVTSAGRTLYHTPGDYGGLDPKTLLPIPPSGTPAKPGLHAGTRAMMMGGCIADAASSILMIIAGILMVTSRPSARRWTIRYGMIAVPVAVWTTLIGVTTSGELLDASGLSALAPQSSGYVAIGSVVGLLLNVGVPVLLVWIVTSRLSRDYLIKVLERKRTIGTAFLLLTFCLVNSHARADDLTYEQRSSRDAKQLIAKAKAHPQDSDYPLLQAAKLGKPAVPLLYELMKSENETLSTQAMSAAANELPTAAPPHDLDDPIGRSIEPILLNAIRHTPKDKSWYDLRRAAAAILLMDLGERACDDGYNQVLADPNAFGLDARVFEHLLDGQPDALPDDKQCQAAANQIERVCQPEMVKLIRIGLAGDASPRARCASAVSFPSDGWPAGVALARRKKLAEDPDPAVRQAVLQMLQRSSTSSQTLIPATLPDDPQWGMSNGNWHPTADKPTMPTQSIADKTAVVLVNDQHLRHMVWTLTKVSSALLLGVVAGWATRRFANRALYD